MKLAIKGHHTRGKEVIELLEMLDGHNGSNLLGNESSYVYFITDSGEIGCRDTNYVLIDYFTLEEFLEKYPYKVGELKDREVDSKSCIIDKMRWNSNKECIEYHGSFGTNDYGWHRAEDFCIYDSLPNIFSQKSKTTEISFNEKSCKPEVELKLGNYEIEVRNGRTFAVLKKPKYPKTYEECCGVLGMTYDYPDIKMVSIDECSLYLSFIELIRCRNAYWKIAGEQMGLGKPWEPDWISGKPFYCISVSGNVIGKGKWYTDNKILAFPTEEMRNTFYENFKNLIEQCKELL